jgi:hypothetical protein
MLFKLLFTYPQPIPVEYQHTSFNMSTPKLDDLEAVRTVVEAVQDFQPDEQQRILRWAIEKLGISVQVSSGYTPPPHAPGTPPPPPSAPGGTTNIKSFMLEKKPRNDVQYAAAVAYYYRFEAPESAKKDAIDKDDLQGATRLAVRERFVNPLQTLNNAHKLGLLDRGSEKGTFVINSVGENLVAMTLPDGAPLKKPAKKAGKKK